MSPCSGPKFRASPTPSGKTDPPGGAGADLPDPLAAVWESDIVPLLQGAPGLRPHYHAGYYGAFVLAHDGNNIEAVIQ